MLGGLDTCDEKNISTWDRSFVISDSRITNLPVEYTGATAIFFGAATVLHRDTRCSVLMLDAPNHCYRDRLCG